MMGNWTAALDSSQDVLEENKRNIRAIFVKAEALFSLCQFEHALVHFHRGLVSGSSEKSPCQVFCPNFVLVFVLGQQSWALFLFMFTYGDIIFSVFFNIDEILKFPYGGIRTTDLRYRK